MKAILLMLLLLLPLGGLANDSVYRVTTGQPLDIVYPAVKSGLESQRLYVVFEPDIGRNLASFAARWGEDYNRQGLDAIRSMVFCNPWYANQVANADPGMLALCPLHLTLTQREGRTTILFIRPSRIARGTAAEAIAAELEDAVIGAIESSLADLDKPLE